MIVVDTTVWIDFFHGAATPQDLHLQRLIVGKRSLALTDLIFCEILQGIRQEAECVRTRDLLLLYPVLRMERLATFEHAAQIYRLGRRRGVTVRKTIDCLIAALCIEEGVELFHKDADFDAIARVAPLQIHCVTPQTA
ncbi:MAG: PIN domain nuclease [Candidatus Methylomirabilota bacterium]|nr:MAG: PIN domain nuclease [candidate division NC10 bacterium]